MNALAGIRVLDLSRALAAPACTQLLGDLGAEIIKVEKPGVGDETRSWGPPYVKDAENRDSCESAYFLSCNRNKRSITIDFARSEGAAIVRNLIAKSDVVVENFKVGSLAKYGLDFTSLSSQFPRLIYCSITGYGQTGPYASRPGYDMIAQGLGGLISMTGEANRPPVKVPVPVDDIMTGLYGVIGIFAALRHLNETGKGQQIDLGLLDVQVGWLYNQGLNFLTGGLVPERMGTASPNTVPYQVFQTGDGWMILAANNDEQFKRFCQAANRPDLIENPDFRTNPDRVRNREAVVAAVQSVLLKSTTKEWVRRLDEVSVACCPINNVAQVFEDPQVIHRKMKINMPYPATPSGSIDLIGVPLKFSESMVSYRLPPPQLGEHTDEVLEKLLGITPQQCAHLHRNGIT
jgi:crotonobetainyl-CoA:carnitine CoA-transferase CaiB-like acyl-CoA transferase